MTRQRIISFWHCQLGVTDITLQNGLVTFRELFNLIINCSTCFIVTLKNESNKMLNRKCH